MNAKAAWFDTEYSYRQRVPISNAGSLQTDLQVGITINTSTLISGGKMQSDCDDIRIVTEDGQQIPHWIQEQTADCNSTNTRIWIKLSSVPTTNMNIYLYYGNASATNVEDPEEVFLFFEDFNQNTLDSGKWGTRTHASGTGASYNIASGTINFTTTTAGGYYWLYSTEPIAQPYWIETNVRNNYATNGSVVRMGYTKAINIASNGNLYPGYGMDDAGNSTLRIVGDTTAGGILITSVANATTSGIWRFGWLSTGSQQAFLNDTSVMTGTNSTNPIGNSYLYLGAPSNTTTGTVSMDWVFARKYVSTQPTIGTFGSEEISPGAAAYWKLDEGYGTTTNDSTENANNGTFGTGNSAPVWTSENQCISGKCLFFDGTSDNIAFGSALSEISTSQGSVSMWFKTTDSTGVLRLLFYGSSTTGGNGGGSHSELHLNLTSNNLQFFIEGSAAGGDVNIVTSTTYNDGKWHHVTATWDITSTADLYIDGSLVGSTTHDANQFSFSAVSYLGRPSAVERFYNGFMDEVKIYPYARTADEVKADFIQGASSKGSAAVLGRSDQSYLSEGLVGYWKMDESTWVGANAVLDSSGNLNSGTAVNGAGITSPGKFGNGGRFDGTNDYAIVTDSGTSPLDVTNKLTFSAWINPSSIAAFDPIFAKIPAAFGSGYEFTNSSGTLRTTLRTSGGNCDYSGGSLTASVWQHVVATYDGSNIRHYINGQYQGMSSNCTYGSEANNEALLFGRRAPSDGTWYSGIIDEVRIYNRAFAEREVTQLYEWAPEAVAYWDFNENTLTTANDKSGNGFTGTITGAEWGPGKYGSGLRFNGADYVDVASPSFPGIGGHITLSMWVNGDAALQPQTNSVFEGYGVGSTRVLNAHLPWSNSNIYWDAGPGTAPYDRINAVAPTTSFEGEWNHWAFTKDINTGSMKIYLNGSLFHSGVGNTRPIGTMTTFRIGSYANGTENYDGLIDDFRIYNYERTPKQIVQDMNAGHPAVGSPVASPVAYYKLDEGYSSVINNGGNIGSTINGTILGTSAPTWSNDGKFGKALTFDGTDDYIRMPHNDAINFSTSDDFTVSAWFKAPTGTVVNVGGAIVEKWVAPGGYPFTIRMITGGLINVARYNGTTSAGIATTIAYNDNKWHQAIFIKQGTLLSLYMDGKLTGTTTDVTGTTTNTNPLFIGSRGGAVNSNFKGLVDEVKIYNYPLTEAEIKVDYNETKAIVLGSVSTGIGGTTPSNGTNREYCVPGDTSTCNSPVAEWLMNENTGTTVYDTSENSRNGTFGTGGSTPTWGVGIEGPAVRFDGTGDHVSTASEISFSSATSFTVSGWVNPTVVDATDRYVLDRTTGTNELINIFSTGTDDLSFRIRGDNNAGITSTTAPNVLVAGQWLYFTGVRDVSDDTLKLYINGKFVSQVTDGTTGTNSPIFRIGNHSGAASGWFGMIDQVRIYDYARTPAQIVWEYSKGSPTAHYKMDECEGTTIYNSTRTFNDSAAGNNGTLTIGASGSNTTVGTCSTSGAWADGATGKRGSSLDFDGTDDRVTFTTSGVLETTAGSVALWLNLAGSQPNPAFAFSNPASGTNSRVYLAFGGGTTMAATLGATSIGSFTLNTGQWYHAVLTWNGTAGKYYINGRDVTTTGTFEGQTSFVSPTIIGCQNSSGTQCFNGKIDDVRIYNYALTPQQIKTVYNNGAVSFE